jgi:hypothetical protein
MSKTLTLSALAAALLLAACPGNQPEDESQNAPKKTSTTLANPQQVPENSTAMNPVVPPQQASPGSRPSIAPGPGIAVDLTEYEIGMPDTIPAGQRTFTIVNHGKENHSFQIDGNGISQALPSPLTRGDVANLSVNLKPGTYTVSCPVDGHKGKGMTRTITAR